jgi:hypothetical protein
VGVVVVITAFRFVMIWWWWCLFVALGVCIMRSCFLIGTVIHGEQGGDRVIVRCVYGGFFWGILVSSLKIANSI